MIKEFVYRMFHKFPVLAKGVSVSGGFVVRQPMNIVLTVDTEPGFVWRKNDKRVWEYQTDNPLGYTKGVEHIKELLYKYKIPATFFVSNQCDMKKLAISREDVLFKRFEVGAHLHVGKCAKYLSENELKKHLSDLKDQLSVLSVPVSFRYGVWGADDKTWNLLHDLGFKIDSSICPNCYDHLGTYNEYDWRTHESPLNILECPCSTFKAVGKWWRADPCYGDVLIKAFDHYRNHCAGYFVLATHSSECVYDDGTPTLTIKMLERFIVYAKQFNVRFTTLKELFQ